MSIIHQQKKQVLTFILTIMTASMLFIQSSAVWAVEDEGNFKTYGKTVGEYAADWWVWALSIPDNPPGSNPVTSAGTVDCSVAQNGPVWFLAGATAPLDFVNLVTLAVERSCNTAIPNETSLFFPIVNAIFINEPGEQSCADGPLGGPCTVSEKRELLAAFNLTRFSCGLSVQIDGQSVHQIPIVRGQSDPVYITTGADNFLGFGETVDPEAIADGFYVMVPPLSNGEHSIHFGGAFCQPEGFGLPSPGAPFFQLDVTYHFFVGGE